MSVKISRELQDFIQGKLGWVATATTDGRPNLTPKGTIKVLDENTLIFADLFSLKTRANLKQNPKVAITVIDEAKGQGYQFKGVAELIDSGPLFEQVKADLKKAPMELPEPVYVVKVKINAIYNQSAGPESGQKLG